jgi:hypothetical protein
VLLFVLSAGFMTLTGALIAQRWTYIDPGIALNADVSFQVLIMALLGGPGHWLGPLAGVVPLALLFEVLAVHFPNYFPVLAGSPSSSLSSLCPAAWSRNCGAAPHGARWARGRAHRPCRSCLHWSAWAWRRTRGCRPS